VKIALADEVMSATAPSRAKDFMMTVPPKDEVQLKRSEQQMMPNEKATRNYRK